MSPTPPFSATTTHHYRLTFSNQNSQSSVSDVTIKTVKDSGATMPRKTKIVIRPHVLVWTSKIELDSLWITLYRPGLGVDYKRGYPLGFLFAASLISKIIYSPSKMVLPNDVDLLNPPADLEKRKHKLKRLVQSPNSFFMDVKCQGCFNITTVFSHSQTVVVCGNCQTVLCQPTGGRARLTEGCSFRRKGD
ncbi:hypothetical protein L2E82_13171 [Cichorium intybus]|nr:hypothetical protein L2E82_13171 [Cichorium intybus]